MRRHPPKPCGGFDRVRMAVQGSNRDVWVVLAIQKQEFALPAKNVREILAMPEIRVVPMAVRRTVE
ncbi:MAG: hypothetical protein ABI693_24805 [Bryobacteraceae bacterium]